MAISKVSGRQYPLVASVTFAGGTDVDAIATYEAIDLPGGAIITGGSFYTPAGFAGAGTIAIHLDALVLVAAADIDAETYSVFDMATIDALNAALTEPNTIDVVLAVAVLTDGVGRVIVEYIIDERANEVNP